MFTNGKILIKVCLNERKKKTKMIEKRARKGDRHSGNCESIDNGALRGFISKPLQDKI